MHTILCITCKDTAAVQGTTDLPFMLSLNGKSGILFLMNAIKNFETLLITQALYSHVTCLGKKGASGLCKRSCDVNMRMENKSVSCDPLPTY